MLLKLFIGILFLLLIGGSEVKNFPVAHGSTSQTVPIIFPSPAYCSRLGIFRAISVPMVITIPNFTLILLVVFHNSIGQIVEISTATFTLAGGENQTIPVIMNRPYGNYTISVFVWSPSGAAISTTQTLVVTC